MGVAFCNGNECPATATFFLFFSFSSSFLYLIVGVLDDDEVKGREKLGIASRHLSYGMSTDIEALSGA